jgi:hypothetical protein
MPLASVTEHTVTPLLDDVEGAVIEGEAADVQRRGRPFPGVLFLPATQQLNRMGRQVSKPTLMYEVEQFDEAAKEQFEAVLRSGDRVGIVAPEQNEAEGLPEDTEIVWIVDGAPQPLGRPGGEPRAMMVTVKRVED